MAKNGFWPLNYIQLKYYYILKSLYFLQLFVEACQKNKNIKVAIIDHISSCSAIKFPVKKIIEALKSFDILILIDGAHAPGQIPNLDLGT